MAKEAMKSGDTVEVAKSHVRALMESLDHVRQGDFATRFEIPFDDAMLKDVQTHLNNLVTELDYSSTQLHKTTMDLAMGLSECFQALSEVRNGNYEARVSDYVLQSEDELLSKFGAALNATITDLQETIERQRFAIQTLSTPILQIWDGVLALPIIGVLDTKRSNEIMVKLLDEIVARHCRYVILDITGVDMVDTKTADYLIKVINASQLLGTKCLLTGIRPAVAQTLVEIGLDLSAITTLRNLQEGLKECLRQNEARGKA
jgi:anti-anti-sigma regulatory factor